MKRAFFLVAVVCTVTMSGVVSRACVGGGGLAALLVPGSPLLEGWRFSVFLPGYTTFAATPGQFCGCGLTLNPEQGNFEIEAVRLINSATGAPIAGFDFSSNEGTSTSLEGLEGTGGWKGFLSSISGAVPDGMSASLVFDVFVPPPCCFDALDANDDGLLTLPDVLAVTQFAVSGAPLPAPGALQCGPDPTDNDGITCADYGADLCQRTDCPPTPAGPYVAGGNPGDFRRGDANCDGCVTLTDAEYVSNFLFGVLPNGGANLLFSAVGDGMVATDEAMPTGEVTESHLTLEQPEEVQFVEAVPFLRGDGNSDGRINIADPSFIANFIFGVDPATPPPCEAAADANGDGRINTADPSYVANFVFGILTSEGLPPPAPPAPHPNCGTADLGMLTCEFSPGCSP